MTRRALSARVPMRSALVLLVSLAAVSLTAVALTAVALPERVRIPKLQPHPPGTPAAAAAFSHGRHAAMACYTCHPGIFPQALLGFSHREMKQGRYCGACHGAGGARSIDKMACGECHAEP